MHWKVALAKVIAVSNTLSFMILKINIDQIIFVKDFIKF